MGGLAVTNSIIYRIFLVPVKYFITMKDNLLILLLLEKVRCAFFFKKKKKHHSAAFEAVQKESLPKITGLATKEAAHHWICWSKLCGYQMSTSSCFLLPVQPSHLEMFVLSVCPSPLEWG